MDDGAGDSDGHDDQQGHRRPGIATRRELLHGVGIDPRNHERRNWLEPKLRPMRAEFQKRLKNQKHNVKSARVNSLLRCRPF